MDIEKLEKELKKRFIYPYVWGVKQNNQYDKLTNFIYKTKSFEELLNRIQDEFESNSNYNDLKNYALNRWYNFWSAKAIETIFCNHELVKPHENPRNKFVDFYIDSIPFDHKTTVFPKGFKNSIPYAINHKKVLINWLYKNQSKQQRQHFKNRLYIVLIDFDNQNEHWKLKAEITWLRGKISTYLTNFEHSKLHTLSFEDSIVKADIIWAIK